jgi:pimeloyl-ACP methyl ester carboxylesterase
VSAESGPELIRLGSGRSVAMYRLAAGDGRTVVLCHAAPGSGAFDPRPEDTAARRVTLVALDRPGYGRSDPMPAGEWSTVDQAADDLAEVLDGVSTGPVGVAGWSAGGRVALALAARRPDLVDRVAVIATPAPDGEVPWIPPDIRAAIESLRPLPAERAQAMLAEQLAPLVPADPRAPEAIALIGGGPADEVTALSIDGAKERLGEMLAAAFLQGATGMAADIAGYTLRPWGFEPADVAAKTLLVYGDADPLGGSRHGRWWQGRLPNARLEMVPGGGHLVIVPMWRRVLSHLAPSP